MSGNEVKFKVTATETVSKELIKVGTAFDKIGGRGSSASLFGNVGAKAISRGFDLVGEAAGAAVDVLKDSVRAAADHETAMAKLRASLKANVEGWNGNTDAIENATQAGIKLGFSDEDQINSMSGLLVATKNVSEAVRVQRVAMDLARLKGVSLADATLALTKVEGGQFRALKAMGIELEHGATRQDALNAVMKAATGQAEAYTQTLNGKLAVANAKWEDASQKLGEHVIPILTGAVDALNWSLEGTNLRTLLVTGKMDDFGGSLKHTYGQLVDVSGMLSETDQNLQGLHDAVRGIIRPFQTADSVMGDFRTGLSLTGQEALDLVNSMIDLRNEAAYLGGVGKPRRKGDEEGRGTPGFVKPHAAQWLKKHRKPKQHAMGGWVGLDGPELSWVGEAGPEYIVPNSDLGGAAMGGQPVVIAVQIDRQTVGRVVDEHLFYRRQRSPA